MKRLTIAVALLAALAAQAQTSIKDAWVRGTVAGQKATGMFAQVDSKSGGKLVAASSPVAGVVEIHEMAMDGTTMKMRAVPSLDLPAGKVVDLKPGGYHVMLMDLKRPLKAGERVTLELRIETKDKRLVTQPIEVEVATRAPAAAGASAHKH